MDGVALLLGLHQFCRGDAQRLGETAQRGWARVGCEVLKADERVTTQASPLSELLLGQGGLEAASAQVRELDHVSVAQVGGWDGSQRHQSKDQCTF